MNYRRDLRSKLMDGLLPSLALYLLAVLVLLPAPLFQAYWGGPGLLLYLLALLAIAMFSLQRALVTRYSEVTRAWYGMAGGLLAWSVVELAGALETRPLFGPTPAVLLIMAGLITVLLWRPLPVGARFFLAACLADGVRQLTLQFIGSVSGWSPALQVLYLGIGVGAAGGVVFALAWIFVFSEWQVQRMWGALTAALLGLTALTILGGLGL